MFLFRNFALKPLQFGENMSNNKIMQFSYFYWDTNEKKAEEKTILFHDGICHDCDIAWCFWKNASWDTIRSSSGQRAKTWWIWRVISIIAKNKPHAHHKTHLHTVNETLQHPISLLPHRNFSHRDSSFFFDDWNIHLFPSNRRFQAIEFVDFPLPEKLDY